MLVKQEALPRLDSSADLPLDAIYVPTRSRPRLLKRALLRLKEFDLAIYALATDISDLPAQIGGFFHLIPEDPELVELISRLSTYGKSPFLIETAEWDLPLKRNYALLHARSLGYRRILLLDDDILLTREQLLAGAKALDRYQASGYFVTDFPDTSIIGHVELATGQEFRTFMSGSCLFLRLDVPVGPFPPIYNEDWLCMAPIIASSSIVSLGNARQLPYDPFLNPRLAALQEPGEIIAEGLFSLLETRQFDLRFAVSAWRCFISLRKALIVRLMDRTADSRHQEALTTALEAANAIHPAACVEFVQNWELDRSRW